ncbi:hypothetical protein DSO57_1025541 [Entomophthora muscae]|uniref:Uncharacterized protein n=1 Tax=Entomophthora muscae TaxID=34485 RepID=A0ACC2UM51_9FUNG|nr:hypothetical protein DSO57_1025541 [Entomophthora muscae]
MLLEFYPQYLGITPPKMDLARFKKGMVMIKALFRAHPENYYNNTQKVMMVAAKLRDDTREVFLNLLEEDPDLILLYEVFLERMNSATAPTGAKVQAYMGLLFMSQGRDVLEAYIQRFLRLAEAAELPDNISGLYFRNGLNNHHVNLMRHHHCNLPKDKLLAIAHGMDFSQPQQYAPRNYQPQGNQAAARPCLNMAPEEYQHYVQAGLCFYCHQNDHLSKDCPTRSSIAQNPTISTINSSSQSYPIIQATLLYSVVNVAIHHFSILPLMGYFINKYLSFSFASQNELMSKLVNIIFWLPDSA